MRTPIKAPLWRTQAVAFRKLTNSRMQLLFTGTGYETISQCQAAAEGLEKNGFKTHVIRDEIIGHIEQNHV